MKMKNTTLLCFAMTSLVMSQAFICIRQPFGPKMCQELCKSIIGCSCQDFNALDLSCRAISYTPVSASWKNCSCIRKIKRTPKSKNVTRHDICYTDATCTEEPKSLPYPPNITLYLASEKGDVCMVQYILMNRLADINFRNTEKNGTTPVMAAAIMAQVTIVDYLISQGCDLTVIENTNNSLLHDACIGGNTDIVRKLLVSKVCDIDSRGWKMWTPVMFAAFYGHINVCDLLISNGCDVSSLSSRKENVLHVACAGGHVDMVKYILSQNIVSIDSRGYFEETSVMVAAREGHTGVVNLLLNEGCNLEALDSQGNNLLHVACAAGHLDVVRYVVNKRNISLESRGFHKRTPVMFAAVRDHKDIVDLFVSKGCNLKALDKEKNSILHLVCSYGTLDMIKYILMNGLVSIEIRGFAGRTPMLAGAAHGKKVVVEYLLNSGCNSRAVDDDGNNAFHLACFSGDVGTVNYLRKLNLFHRKLKNKHGRTPAQLARRTGHTKLVTLCKSWL